MDAWHKARSYVGMLENKQQKQHSAILKVELRVNQLTAELSELRSEYAELSQRIDLLTPSGVLVRSDLYKGIRQQGTLISFQQLIIHKITMLEQKLLIEKNTIQELSSEMNLLNKKHYKMSIYIDRVKKERMRYIDNNIENDIQEISVYGKKFE